MSLIPSLSWSPSKFRVVHGRGFFIYSESLLRIPTPPKSALQKGPQIKITNNRTINNVYIQIGKKNIQKYFNLIKLTKIDNLSDKRINFTVALRIAFLSRVSVYAVGGNGLKYSASIRDLIHCVNL